MRQSLATAARVVQEVDTSNQQAMATTYQADLAAATSLAELEGMRGPYWRLEEAIRSARALLFASESVLDATGADGFFGVSGCIITALLRLRAGVDAAIELTGVDLEIPAELDSVLSALSLFGEQCGGEP
jgi:hypothetical protein